MPRRRHLTWALLISLAVHFLLLLVLLWSRGKPSPAARQEVVPSEPVVVALVQLPPEPTQQPSPPPSSKPGTRSRARTSERARAAEHHEPAPVAEEAAPEPTTDLPKRLSLVPEHLAPGLEPTEPAPTRGQTLYPDDPSLSEWARSEEEAFRVKGRVDDWAREIGAEARARGGVAHPYLGRVGEALREGLGGTDGGTPNALGAPNAAQALFNQYRGAAEKYAQTGNPGVSTPGLAPRQTEKQREFFGDENWVHDPETGQAVQTLPWTQMFTQSAETLQDLAHSGALLSLTLELRQKPDGAVVSQQLLERSKSSAFDAFVVRVVPQALASLGPVPEEVLRGNPELRTVWQIEGWPRLPPKLEQAMLLFGAPALMGVPLDALLTGSGDQQFRFRARLLKAY